jgi:tetratricopeptide (TPR) repeat protein
MDPERVDPCIELDQIAAFLDGRLEAAAEAALQAHAARCAHCRQVLSALLKCERDEPATADGAWQADTLPRGAAGDPDEALAPGARIGRYVVIARIGAGGMGLVYAAHDGELNRKVALKLLRHDGSDGSARGSLRDRLQREAQAMAQLAHPNVVAVYDVGTVGDRIFIAMELVEGETLAAWLQGPRRWRDVLAQFLSAGAGLAAAHAAGLVHRDFKPENVLIGRDGRVRVGDFGLAHQLPSPAPQTPTTARPRDRLTTNSGSFAGTPYYMAPEQLRGEVADARSDQFSFCVALYAALVGTHPFAGDERGQLLDAVVAGELRPWPRRAPPRWLRRALERGLSLRPEARFPSLAALLAQLTRAPARPLLQLAAAAALTAALAGVVVHVRDARRACDGAGDKLVGVWDAARAAAVERAFTRSDRPFAAAAFTEVKRVLNAYAKQWTSLRSDACLATEVRHEQSAELLDLRMLCLDGHLRDLEALTHQLAGADARLVERAPLVVHGLEDLSDCADGQALRARVRPPGSPRERERVTALRGELAEVKALHRIDHYHDGVVRARALVPEVAAIHYRPLEAETLLELGVLEDEDGQIDASEHTLEQAEWTAEASRSDEVAARAWLALMSLYQRQRAQLDRALALRPRVTALLERVGGNEELEALLHIAVGRVLRDQAHYADAQLELQKALVLLEHHFGRDDLHVTQALDELGAVAARQDWRAADAYYQRSLELKKRIYGPDHPEVGLAMIEVMEGRQREGRSDEARALGEAGLAIMTRALGPLHPALIKPLNNVALILHAQNDNDREVELLRRARDLVAQFNGRDHPRYALVLVNLADALSRLGRHEEAVELLRQALAIDERRLGPEHDRTASCRRILAKVLGRTGRLEEAHAQALRALGDYEKARGVDNPYNYQNFLVLGGIELKEGAAASATAQLERARTLAAAGDLLHDSTQMEIDFALAQALLASHGARERARTLALSARALALADRHMAKELGEIDRWLRRQGWLEINN